MEISLPDVSIVVLGIAQDGGLPQLGDGCENCEAARRDTARRGRVACLGIIDRKGGRAYLIDATPDLVSQWDEALGLLRGGGGPAAAGASPPGPPGRQRTAPDGIFLTHAHMGHYAGLVHLGREAFGAKGVPVWATERMAAYLSANAPWEMLVRGGHVDLRRIVPGEPIELREGLSVTPIASPHRQEYSDTVGYIVSADRQLLYVPDTDGWEAWPTPIEEIVRLVDVALLDGTFHAAGEVPGRSVEEIPHPLVTASMDRLQEIADRRPGSIGFIHMNHTNPLLRPESDERAAVARRGFFVAGEGAVYPLSDP